MTKQALVFIYVFFFFMYFVGFGLMGNLNSGVPYPWEIWAKPLKLSYVFYTVLTVLLAHFFIFRKFYYVRPRWKLAAAITGLLVFYILFRYTLEEIIYPATLGYGNYYGSINFRYYIIDNVYFGSIIIFIGFALFMFDELFRNQNQKAALLEQNRQAELNFLQVQMNPHFLFNSLNNIYALARRQHPQTAESVLKLSEIMRYTTYQRTATVMLETELDYVKNLTDIQQLRYEHQLQVHIAAAPETLPVKIIPLMLIPLVENALKHGDLADEHIPLSISTALHEEQLTITISNKIAMNTPATKGGIGLKNLQRRLVLSYKEGTWSFTTKTTGNIFLAELVIPVAH